MATRAQKVRLALFLLVSTSVLVIFLVVVTGVHLLRPRDHYYVEFAHSLGGLNKGDLVKYLGTTVGRVEDTFIDSVDLGTVVVEISLDRAKAGSLIRTDTQAKLYSEGLLGFKHIELLAGSQSAQARPPGSRIPSSDTWLADFSEKAQELTVKLERLIDNANHLTRRENSERFGSALEQSRQLMTSGNRLLADNEESFDATFRNLATATEALAGTAASLEATMDSLHQIVADGHLRGTIQNLHLATRAARVQLEGPVPELLAHMTRATGNIDTTVTRVDRVIVKARKDFLDAMVNLEETLENIRQATELIREDPSILIRGRAEE